MSNPYQQYRSVQTTTASGMELVLMLYRGAVRFLNNAVSALDARDLELAHQRLIRAQDIVRELRATLDLERGGEVAAQLERLYAYCEQRLIQANLQKDAEPIAEVRALLQELAVAWEGLSNGHNQAAAS